MVVSERNKMFEVYTKGSGCTYCTQAKQLLEKEGIEFKEHIIGIHVLRETFLNLFPEAKTVPQIVDDGVIVGGFTDLVEYLKNREETTEELLQG
jgi:glutaredoxin